MEIGGEVGFCVYVDLFTVRRGLVYEPVFKITVQFWANVREAGPVK